MNYGHNTTTDPKNDPIFSFTEGTGENRTINEEPLSHNPEDPNILDSQKFDQSPSSTPMNRETGVDQSLPSAPMNGRMGAGALEKFSSNEPLSNNQNTSESLTIPFSPYGRAEKTPGPQGNTQEIPIDPLNSGVPPLAETEAETATTSSAEQNSQSTVTNPAAAAEDLVKKFNSGEITPEQLFDSLSDDNPEGKAA